MYVRSVAVRRKFALKRASILARCCERRTCVSSDNRMAQWVKAALISSRFVLAIILAGSDCPVSRIAPSQWQTVLFLYYHRGHRSCRPLVRVNESPTHEGNTAANLFNPLPCWLTRNDGSTECRILKRVINKICSRNQHVANLIIDYGSGYSGSNSSKRSKGLNTHRHP